MTEQFADDDLLAGAEIVLEAERVYFARLCDVEAAGKSPRARHHRAARDRAWIEFHERVVELREIVAVDRARVETLRQELARDQYDAGRRADARLRTLKGAEPRETARRESVEEACRLWSLRDALGWGLGWPHRGEEVRVKTDYPYEGQSRIYDGVGWYIDPNDIYAVSHAVSTPAGTVPFDTELTHLYVDWSLSRVGASGYETSPDPDGEIAMRLLADPERPLPCPIPRWPERDDLSVGTDPFASIAEGEQLTLAAGSPA